MKNDVAVVILAGGEGSRIGGDKPLRRLGGERLIDQAMRHGRRWSPLVAVAARNPAQVKSAGVPVIIDEHDVAGPLGGLIAALTFGERSGCDFVLSIPADMPFLPPDLLERLRSGIGECGCAIAASDGQLHPICGLWRTAALDRVGIYLAGESRSLRGFAAMIGFRETDWPVEPADPFFNINTAEDLAEASRRAGN